MDGSIGKSTGQKSAVELNSKSNPSLPLMCKLNSVSIKFFRLLLESLKDEKSLREFFHKISEAVLIDNAVLETIPSPVHPGIRRLIGDDFLFSKLIDSFVFSEIFWEKIGSSQSLALKGCSFNL